MFSSKNKIGVNLCWVFATFSVLLISSTDAALDLSDLTEEENMALQEELFNYELDKLTPEQKQLMQIKWETVKALVQQNCQYFQLGTNLTTYMVKMYNCMEKFGYDEKDINKLSPQEYVAEVCDNENWNEFLECGMESTQGLVLSFFRCFMGVDYAKPGGNGDSVKYIVLERIPQLLNLFRKFGCDNKEFLMKSFEMKEHSKELVRILTETKTKKDTNSELRVGLCYLQRNPGAADRTYCEHFANLDYKSSIACISEHEGFQTPAAQAALQRMVPIMKFLLDKNSGGPHKAELLRHIWQDFCAPGSYLSTIFNNRPTSGKTSRNEEQGKQKSPFYEENGFLGVVLKLGKVNLASEQNQDVEASLKKLHFVRPGPECKNRSVASRLAKGSEYWFEMYGCLANFGFEDYSKEADRNWAAQQYRAEFCDAESWQDFQACALGPTQSLFLMEFHCILKGLEKSSMDLKKPIHAADFLMMNTFPNILDAVWKLLCTQKTAFMGTIGLTREDGLALRVLVGEVTNLATSIEIQRCLLQYSNFLDRGDRSYCEHLEVSDYSAGLNCVLEAVSFDNLAASKLWKKLAPVVKLILDKTDGLKNGKPAFIKTIWQILCSQESPFAPVLNSQIGKLFSDDNADKTVEQRSSIKDEL